MSGFVLDERLAADSLFLADGPLSQVRLMDDARWPWIVGSLALFLLAVGTSLLL